MGKLEGKVALITGAGSGIGRATALLFAQEGAKVIVADYVPAGGNETVKMVKDAGAEASFVDVDVSKPADIQRMVKTTVDTYGRIDILCNNAGIQGPVNKTSDIPEEDWILVLDTNLNSVFLGSKYTIPIMQKQGGGVIINTSSTMGLGGKSNVAPYACSKAGIISLTKTMAAEYGQDNIRVNAICPGVIYCKSLEQEATTRSDVLTQSAFPTTKQLLGTCSLHYRLIKLQAILGLYAAST